MREFYWSNYAGLMGRNVNTYTGYKVISGTPGYQDYAVITF